MSLSAIVGRYWVIKAHACLCLALDRKNAAKTVFDRMIARWPHDAFALAGRAHLSARLGRPLDAIADLKAIVRHHPRRSAADWFNLAFLLELTDRIDEAEAAFRQAIELNPKLDRAWYGLGITLVRQGRLDEAAAALKRNTDLQPMSPYGWYQLARVQLDRNETGEARRIIEQLRAFAPAVADQLVRETGLSG